MAKVSLQVAVDIGGTFTDVVVARRDGQVAAFKVLSTPSLLGKNVSECIDDAQSQCTNSEVAGIVHATTIVSNTVIESQGAITGLVTTKGFRDELEIRRFIRPSVTGFLSARTPPLIPRRRRLEVGERIDAQGEVVLPLDEADVFRAIETFSKQGVEAVAISLINSYINPLHEQRVAELIRERHPGLEVAASSDVLAEIGEYERTSTTALTAYISPVVNRYLDDLEKETKRYHPSLFMMQANGGVVPAGHIRRFPAGTIESGPAAGVLAACVVARELGLGNAVSFDMGGTTVKTMLIRDGTGGEKPDMQVGGDPLVANSGYALRFPGFDLVEIGAGGGSIAWTDAGGALRTGPQSAGAVPAPVCYGRGGKAPTVTDANVVLGYMSPVALAGGTIPVNRSAAVRAFERELCPTLKLTALEAAYGVHQVANVTMMRALRSVTTERGQDPRECALIAFGGAGPIHAANLAGDLEMSHIVIPRYPGLFSALGLLLADLRFDYVQSIPERLDEMGPDRLGDGYETLTARARAELKDAGVDPDQALWHRLIDLHYQRQSMALTIPLPEGVPSTDLSQVVAKHFHEEHEAVYGYQRADEAVAVLNVRIRVTAPGGNLSLKQMGEAFLREAKDCAPLEGVRNVYFGSKRGSLRTRILSRAALYEADTVGPAIVEEFDTTVVVPPGWRASLDDYANIILRPS